VLRQDLSGRNAELRASRVPFVHARVVLAERPTSAKPGDEAIVQADGTIEGFVGGECAETTVRVESLQTLRTGEAVLLRITPTAEPGQAGKKVVHNACLSGGTLEVFLEPLIPPRLVQVVGHTPTADALLALGRPLGYAMSPYDGHIEPDAEALVVASHGRDETEALVAALQAGVRYVGLVASRRRGSSVVAALPVTEALRATVHTPAGLDIGATRAGEVALSILAEIVATRPRHDIAVAGTGAPAAPVRVEIDPVCGMSVLPDAEASHVLHEGRTVWFCGRGCLEAFVAHPAAYTSTPARP
jgi:xanthine dehydrogenase accessory factor